MRRAALILVLALASCGFKPMYAPGGGAALGQIEVPEVGGKAGHAFRTEFMRFQRVETSQEQRRLEISIQESITPLGLRVDESASRADLTLTAVYKLLDARGQELVTGKLVSVASYDVPSSAYGEIAAQNDARERAGVLLAERLRVELAARLAAARPS